MLSPAVTTPAVSTPPEEIAEALQRIGPLQGLPLEDRLWLAQHGQEFVASAGDVLFEEGAPATNMILILKGEIHVRRQHGGPMALFIGRAGQMTGVLPQPAPVTLLFETWYELGLVGAATAAACLYFAIRAAGRMPGALSAGGVAAFTTAFALGTFGFAPLLPWWLMTLTAVVLMFGAIARGQYRTDRPAVPLPMRAASHTRPKAGNPPASGA